MHGKLLPSQVPPVFVCTIVSMKKNYSENMKSLFSERQNMSDDSIHSLHVKINK